MDGRRRSIESLQKSSGHGGWRENNRTGIGKREREDESFNEASTDYWTDDCRFMCAKQAPYKSAAPDTNITFLTSLTGII